MEISGLSVINISNEIQNLTSDSWFNESLEDYLTRALGPKHLPLKVVLPITVIYVLIFVSGIVGNVAVCMVIARNKSMRTATNYYLFSLAVSDLTLLILGLPYDLSVYWQQYPWMLGETLCKLRALGSEMSNYTSILTIVAFSTERYLAICQPIQSYTTSSPRIAIRVIAVLWIVSLLCAMPFAVYTKINYIPYPPGTTQLAAESAFCAMLEHAMPKNWPMYELSAFVFFLGPMLIIMVLYARMGVTIRSRTQKFPGETKHLNSRTKPIIRMLAAVVITFFLCWAPFHMQRLFYLYGKESPGYDKINEMAYFVTGCLYFFSCTVNPVLYNVMSAKYRLAFQKTLCCGKHRGYPTREPSTFRDTTVVYVNSHLEHCRSVRNKEVRSARTFSRNSKNSNIHNNMLEKTNEQMILQHEFSPTKTDSQDNNCNKLLDSSCDPAYKDQVSDILTANSSNDTFPATKTWSKALLRIAKQSNEDNGSVTEPCLKHIKNSAQITKHSVTQEETSI